MKRPEADRDVEMDDHEMEAPRRALWRVFGWGGALVFSLLVWTALFGLVRDHGDRERRCADGLDVAATATQCPPHDQG
ncbi:hypothetical protein [uncultured Brevundimonas sp.]|uniref:hypothetical protein n=1 Tax=uncultured Brevundimonas sp. TaxID=213418 RepID=UPI00261A5C75|nr:hypothetical protein [uncultured Brevundimonas sp.]